MRLAGRPVPAAVLTALLATPVILAQVLIATPANGPEPIDAGVFGPPGAALLTGHWNLLFGDPVVQAGPFELAPYGVADLLDVQGRIGWTLFSTVASVLTAFLVALALRTGPGARSSVLAGVGTLVLCGTGAVSTWALGHPSEVLIPLCWVLAARLAVADRPVAAAAVVAASTGFEVWGVLGAPVVLLAAHPRPVRAAAAGAAVLAALWAPLVVAGPFRMFEFRWSVLPPSLLHLIDPAATAFPWPLRLVQAALAIGAGTAVAVALRHRAPRVGVWLAPAAVVAARLVLDPVLADYYWSPVEVAAVGLLVLGIARRNLALAAAAAAMLLLTSAIAPPVPRALVLTVLLVAGSVAAARFPAVRGFPRAAGRTAATT